MNTVPNPTRPTIPVVTPPQPTAPRRPAKWLMAMIAGVVAVGLASALIIRNQAQQGASAHEVRVDITATAFEPNTVTIDAGNSVTWTNQDTTAHGVAIDGLNVSAPHALARKQSYTYMFTQKGTFNYYDTQNLTYPKGTIVVR